MGFGDTCEMLRRHAGGSPSSQVSTFRCQPTHHREARRGRALRTVLDDHPVLPSAASSAGLVIPSPAPAEPWSCQLPTSLPQTWCWCRQASTPWRATPHLLEAITSLPNVSGPTEVTFACPLLLFVTSVLCVSGDSGSRLCFPPSARQCGSQSLCSRSRGRQSCSTGAAQAHLPRVTGVPCCRPLPLARPLGTLVPAPPFPSHG